uniref:Uncharacterized protein n=1 Tax=Florenciella parvula TaxID=236787 RepID=A0A7S2FH70_9STRA|mmetsp:Transcript_15133/g.31734  ORF Transcript_15133/g.31734 Transcript_15133/m.31734 type:complete len:131 (+) Transcript_15133:2-394(+)
MNLDLEYTIDGHEPPQERPAPDESRDNSYTFPDGTTDRPGVDIVDIDTPMAVTMASNIQRFGDDYAGPLDGGALRAVSAIESDEKFKLKAYPFLNANYTQPYLTAFDDAVEEHKLVHIITLWGRLDDQAC